MSLYYDPIHKLVDYQLRSMAGRLEDIVILGCLSQTSLVGSSQEQNLINAIDAKFHYFPRLLEDRGGRVLRYHDQGYSIREIADMEAVSQQAINKILNHRWEIFAQQVVKQAPNIGLSQSKGYEIPSRKKSIWDARRDLVRKCESCKQRSCYETGNLCRAARKIWTKLDNMENETPDKSRDPEIISHRIDKLWAK